MPARLSMDIYRGDELLETREYTRDIIKIGRLSSAHLRLEDEKVSRIHSVVEINAAGEISIIDMGSAVGTIVNGERINKGTLSDGDEITIGDTRIVLHVLEAAAEEPAAAAAAPAADDATVVEAPSPAVGADAPAEPAAAAPPPPPAEALEPPAEEAPAAAAPEPPVEEEPVPADPAARAAAAVAAVEAVAAAPAPEPPPPSPPPVEAAPVVQPAAAAMPEVQAEAPDGEALVPDPIEFDPTEFVHEKGQVPDPDDRSVELRFMWGEVLLNVAHYKRPKQISVGESKKADFFLAADDLADVADFPLIRYDGDYQLAFTRKMEGLVRIGDETFDLKQLVDSKKAIRDVEVDGAYTVAMPADSRASLKFGGVTVLVRFVPPPKKLLVPWTEGINYQFLNLFLFCMFLHLALLITATNYPYDTDLIADDLFKSPNRFAKFILKPPEPVKNERLEALLDSLKKSDPGEAAAKAKDDEGKMGRKSAPDRNTRSAPKAIDINSKDIIKQTGIFKMLKEGGSAGVSTIFGEGGLGGDLHGALGGLVGSSVGDARGVGGLGLKGTGGGGGGLSGSTFGVGGIGTKGRGGGLGGYGTGVGGLGKKKDSDISISSGSPVVMGSLDKELIRRVIRSHISQVRYCYERELQSKPGLYGKIGIKFTISAAGAVTTAKIDSSTMGNSNVESCLVSRVKTWKFPKPKGGGIVIVTYPFVFKQGG